jgi:Holliday junction DNA helicase RuvA
MIASVHGIVQGLRENTVIIRVGGIGLDLNVPTGTYNLLAGEIGQPIDLYTYLVVREDALTLYGFTEEQQRFIFQQLLGVSGVGPRLALSVLSTLTPEMLANAIQRDEPDLIARVPGVGKKTAQKIVLDMKGKLLPETLAAGLAAVTASDTEVIEALTALGYSIVEAQAALQAIPRDAPDDIEERVRLALGYFSS